MRFNGKPLPGHGPLLLFSQLEVLSFEENLLIARTSKRLRINASYRMKLSDGADGICIPCHVSACELQIVRGDDGKQVPCYKAAIELDDGGSEADVAGKIRACLSGSI